jgi:hypothetical protein
MRQKPDSDWAGVIFKSLSLTDVVPDFGGVNELELKQLEQSTSNLM